MFDWLKRKMVQANVNLYQKEMQAFLYSLQTSDAGHLSAIIATASKAAREFAFSFNCDLYTPFQNIKKHPQLDIVLFEQMGKAQKRGDYLSKSVLALWLHTIRGAAYPDLFELSKEIWRELNRATGGVIRYPDGFEPQSNLEVVSLLTHELEPFFAYDDSSPALIGAEADALDIFILHKLVAKEAPTEERIGIYLNIFFPPIKKAEDCGDHVRASAIKFILLRRLGEFIDVPELRTMESLIDKAKTNPITKFMYIDTFVSTAKSLNVSEDDIGKWVKKLP